MKVSSSEIEVLRNMIRNSKRIVFFGGAGTSTESAIPDFRSESGLYRTETSGAYPPEVMLSHSFFVSHTEEFFEFYKTKMIYRNARPNAAHFALVRLEEEGKLAAVITQNIDGLHQMAGSRNVLELHGSVHRNTCLSCGAKYGLDAVADSPETIPRCTACGGIIKPDVVLYGESLDMDVLNAAVSAVEQADMLIVGGTSLTVNPAAGLVRYYRGDRLVLINKSSTPYDRNADLIINDSIGGVLEAALQSL